MEYKFNESDVFDIIKNDWLDFAEAVGTNKFILGISGGIDSTTVAALACKIFGKENVYGLSMPCDGQKDIDDVNKVFEHLGIKRFDFDIGDANRSVINGVENNGIDVSNQTKTNLPARLRMASVYAFAQSLNAIVLNTCNLSEDILGWNTFGGDNIGSYAPLHHLTKTEVRKLAIWLNIPSALVSKTPIDGLQSKSDEENFGFTYAEFDDYLRTGNASFKFANKSKDMYLQNKFKLDIVDLPGPKFDFLNYVIEE